MARTQSNLAVGSLTTTSATSVYAVPSGSVVTPYLVLCNTSGADMNADVIINDGSTDRIVETLTINTGNESSVFAGNLATQKLNGSFSVKIQPSSTGNLNYFLSGSIIT